jgi:hypothetical protein
MDVKYLKKETPQYFTTNAPKKLQQKKPCEAY